MVLVANELKLLEYGAAIELGLKQLSSKCDTARHEWSRLLKAEVVRIPRFAEVRLCGRIPPP
jgi:hypothetical protein